MFYWQGLKPLTCQTIQPNRHCTMKIKYRLKVSKQIKFCIFYSSFNTVHAGSRQFQTFATRLTKEYLPMSLLHCVQKKRAAELFYNSIKS